MKPIQYIYLAVGTAGAGTVMVYAALLVAGHLNIDVTRHLWILIIPIALSLLLNVILIEIYRKIKK